MPSTTASVATTETQPDASKLPAESGRERILSVAAERFLSAGYVETSLRDIAADAGMKAGSLYYHFGSKDELLIAVLERGMSFMVDAFEAADAAVTTAPSSSGAGAGAERERRRLAAHIEGHLEALHGNREFTAGHVTLFRTAPPAVRDAILPLRDEYEGRWSRLLSSLLPKRSAPDITMLRLALFGAMNASIDWLDTDRGSVAEFARLVTDQFWSGVAAAPATTTGHERGQRQ